MDELAAAPHDFAFFPFAEDEDFDVGGAPVRGSKPFFSQKATKVALCASNDSLTPLPHPSPTAGCHVVLPLDQRIRKCG